MPEQNLYIEQAVCLRRKGHFYRALKLLGKSCFDGRYFGRCPEAIPEYCQNLAQFGDPLTAYALLQRYADGSLSAVKLANAACLIMQWRHAEAVTLITSALDDKELLTKYLGKVWLINLFACSVYSEGEENLDNHYKGCLKKLNGYPRLLINLESLAYLAKVLGKLNVNIKTTEFDVGSLPLFDRLTFAKNKCLHEELIEKSLNKNQALLALKKVKRQAEEAQYFEIAIECIFWEGVLKRNPFFVNSACRLAFFEEMKDFFIREAAKKQLNHHCEDRLLLYKPGYFCTKKSLSPHVTLDDLKKRLKNSSFKIVSLLLTNSGRSQSSSLLHRQLCPKDFISAEISHQRIAMMISRARKELANCDTKIKIVSAGEQRYRINFDKVLIDLENSITNRDFLAEDLGELNCPTLRNLPYISSKIVAEEALVSQRQAQRLIKKWQQEGHLKKLGAGRNSQYRWLN